MSQNTTSAGGGQSPCGHKTTARSPDVTAGAFAPAGDRESLTPDQLDSVLKTLVMAALNLARCKAAIITVRWRWHDQPDRDQQIIRINEIVRQERDDDGGFYAVDFRDDWKALQLCKVDVSAGRYEGGLTLKIAVNRPKAGAGK